MAETADALRRQQEYMQQQTENFLKRAVRETGQAFLIYKETFEGEPKLLREMLLYELMGRLAGSRKDISGVHVRLLEELFAHQPGKRLQLPYQLTAERIYGGSRGRKRRRPLQMAR